ncbi:uncharacterized protein GIQ15_02925 [Arthroderma uncinatum]|uniref:uncharacterized protein n=1 Tax=Arthroderma uncinatum TaxID=74035 RepID=UPI00144A9354|nr:uncharacterized protein GIQ15_02925 [Arthroderma uncinatum]KAF3483601.1 hypothetical protein GIQ15_02925 [Arthroderma uncinatum]
MGYFFYSLSFFIFLSVAAAYFTRDRWLPHLPLPPFLYTQLPTSFRGDAEAGLSSADFNLADNIVEGDSRAGLDKRGKSEVLRIMKSRKVDFNEARRIYTEQRFAKNNIGPDGRPRDPKFVSFS